MKIKNNINKKKINLGIELLRMILSFLIVLVHNLSLGISKNKLYLFPRKNLPYYVPSFFLIAFYFSYNLFISRNIGKIKERFIRILIPYMGWPILFFLRNNYVYYRYGIIENISFKNFYYQLLVGCGMYGIFWFLFNLLFHSIFFVIIILLFNKKYLYILFIITFLNYIFAYSSYGFFFFRLYDYVPVGHSICPIPKMILYSLTGFFLSSLNIINKLYNYRLIILTLSGIFLFIFTYYNILSKIKYFYIGIFIDLCILSEFVFFTMIPFDKINNNIIYIILKQITSYTGGIYYIHPNVSQIFGKYILSIRQRTFIGCLLLYFISYIICLINSFLFRKSKIKFLFI